MRFNEYRPCSIAEILKLPMKIFDISVAVSPDLPLDTLMGPATVVELPEVDIITPELLEAQALPPQTRRLLLKTKNSDLWTDPAHQFNPDFVALSSDSASWIVSKGIHSAFTPF
jgi:kynurenine formamidase